MNVSTININNVKPEDIKVAIDDFNGFSTVDIFIGSSRISMFLADASEASLVAEVLCTVTRRNHRTETVQA